MLIKVLDKKNIFWVIAKFWKWLSLWNINTALQQQVKQQALDCSVHYPDQSCGLDDSSPAATRHLITPSEIYWHIYLMGARQFNGS